MAKAQQAVAADASVTEKEISQRPDTKVEVKDKVPIELGAG
jgi:hypothetical protein